MVEQEALDTVFRALGDPTRRRMLRALADGERTVTELARPFAMSLAAASKHVKALEDAGLIRREVRGRTHVCRLDPRPLAGAHAWLRFYERFWTERLDVLESLLREAEPPQSPTPEERRRRRMSEAATLETYGVVTEPLTVRLERLLPGPVERVWSYLTDSDLRRKWLAAGVMDLTPGAPFELVWRNDELNERPGRRPEGFSEESRMTSEIVAVDAPRKLVFTWEHGGEVTFDLTPKGRNVLLVITHRRARDRSYLLGVSAGWHAHLDVLAARLAGSEPPPFWDGWVRLRQEYDRRIPA